MFLLGNGLLNGGTSSPTPKMLYVTQEFSGATKSPINTITHVKA